MTKRELLEAIYRLTLIEENDVTKKMIEATINALGEVTSTTLQAGGEVTLPGIGKLAVKQRAARTGRNPRTGEAVQIPAKRVLKYTPVKSIKDSLL
jgi:DNA-binding protein HU-beta